MSTWSCNPSCPEALMGASGGETSYVRSPPPQPTGAEAAPATNLRSRSGSLRRRNKSSTSRPHRRRNATEPKNHRGRNRHVLVNANRRARSLLRNRTQASRFGHVELLRQRRALRCRSHRLRDKRSHHQARTSTQPDRSSNCDARTRLVCNESESHFEIEGTAAQRLTCDDNGTAASTATKCKFRPRRSAAFAAVDEEATGG